MAGGGECMRQGRMVTEQTVRVATQGDDAKRRSE